MSSCCSKEQEVKAGSCHSSGGGCSSSSEKPDYMLIVSAVLVALLYILHLLDLPQVNGIHWLHILTASSFELMNSLWWGIAAGILMLSALAKVPRDFVISLLGSENNKRGILRATFAGVLLDLCNHGILMVASKLYERGASVGQVVAFLIASPWNSFSLTFILIALVGLPWTISFILLSMLIAFTVGLMFEMLVTKNMLPTNPNRFDLAEDFYFWPEAKKALSKIQWTPDFIGSLLLEGVKDSRMVIRWVMVGVLLAALIRAFVPADIFSQYFGPTMIGLFFTVIAATVIEVCSEGSVPIAADLLKQAKAPGNSFAFLMSGAATDYTEIMVMKDTTKSWKTALFIPLLTVPQVVLVAWLINQAA